METRKSAMKMNVVLIILLSTLLLVGVLKLFLCIK